MLTSPNPVSTTSPVPGVYVVHAYGQLMLTTPDKARALAYAASLRADLRHEVTGWDA